jgi:polyisoprenoid-binding protein YceI
LKKPLLIIGGAVALGALAVVAVIVIFLLRSDDPNLKTEAPPIPTTPAGASATPTASAASAINDATLPPGTLHFVVDQAGSEAKYVVLETLRGIANSQAVGTTNAVTGDLLLTPTGLASSPQSKFTVDLTKLKTDESQRDNFVRQNVLQTGRFPMAEFVVESITPFPARFTA